MKKNLVLLFLLALIAGFSSCYYDKKELVYPIDSSGCDTSTVSYSKDIVPIYSAKCYSCHSTSAAAALGGGFVLDTYTGASTHADHAAQQVEAGTMPQTGGKLPSCEIAKIRTWARNGAPNN